MNKNLSNLIFRILVSVLTFIVVTFTVAWILEDIIYFSLFIGIPVGIISAIAAFAILSLYNSKTR